MRRHLIGIGALTSEIAEFLKACVRSRPNILISGGAVLLWRGWRQRVIEERVYGSGRPLAREATSEYQTVVPKWEA